MCVCARMRVGKSGDAIGGDGGAGDVDAIEDFADVVNAALQHCEESAAIGRCV